MQIKKEMANIKLAALLARVTTLKAKHNMELVKSQLLLTLKPERKAGFGDC